MEEPAISPTSPTEPQLSEGELFQLVAYLSKFPRWEPLRMFLAPRLLAHRQPPEDESDVPWRVSVRSDWAVPEREWMEDRAGTVAWNAYVLRLVLVCPQFLNPIPGFEWIARAFRQVLRHRIGDPREDAAFWAAVAQVRGALHPAGRPRNDSGIHVSRAREVENLMASEGMGKTDAVIEMAGTESEQRAIWASLKRIKAKQRAFAELLERCGLPASHLRSEELTGEIVVRVPGKSGRELCRVRALRLSQTPPAPAPAKALREKAPRTSRRKRR